MPIPGGGGILQLKSQSAKINANWGGGYSATKKSKVPGLMPIPGGGGILQLKSQSTKINDNSGGGILQLKSQSAKLNANSRGGGILQLKNHKVPRSTYI